MQDYQWLIFLWAFTLRLLSAKGHLNDTFPERCEFRCDEVACILQSQVCNGVFDCYNGADENFCGPCLGMICDGVTCIPQSEICNGVSNCVDGTDEKDCNNDVKTSCDSDSFLCKSGECIPWALQCDRSEDCEDASDESPENCDEGSGEGSGFVCMGEYSYPCSRGGCIQATKVCDGKKDCIDGDDEFDCAVIEDYNTITDLKQESGAATHCWDATLRKIALLTILTWLICL